MKYTIETPKWNIHLHRWESNIILNYNNEVIAIGIGELPMEANDRAEIIAVGLKLHDAMSEITHPKVQ